MSVRENQERPNLQAELNLEGHLGFNHMSDSVESPESVHTLVQLLITSLI